MTPRFTKHAAAVIRERGILLEWVVSTIEAPERTEQRADATVHMLKRVDAFGGRWLRVVLDSDAEPTVITAFFDRRVR